MNQNKHFFSSKYFIVMMAFLSGLTALGIDAILPTFPGIIHSFAIPEDQHNRIQLMVYAYMIGFSALQIVFGTLSDFFGRKRLLIIGLIIYTIASVFAMFATSFETLLWMRFLQGFGLAAPRVISISIIRDVSSGREMSRNMSFVMMAFLMVPAFAPSIGQGILLFSTWQGVFGLLVLAGITAIAWVYVGLPESLHSEDKKSFSLSSIGSAFKTVFLHKLSMIYIIIMTLLFAQLMTYLGLSEQILQKDIYNLGKLFPLVFSMFVFGMIAAAFVNVAIIRKIGMHKTLFISLIILVVCDFVMFISMLMVGGVIPLWLFMAFMMIHFFGFGLAMPNLSALIMEPFPRIAGIMSSISGFISGIFGVLIAQFITQFYNKTLYSLVTGFMVLSLLLLLLNYFARANNKAESN